MKYNFDELIDRTHTGSLKVEALNTIWGRTDLLPLWVADMDFRTPPFIIKALKERMEHEIFGYTTPDEGYYTSISEWVKKQYGMSAGRESIHYIPGIVPGIHFAINALTEKGDKIMIQPPVYHPFKQVINATGRKLVTNPLKLVDNHFEMDFESMEQNIKGCKVFILCNPHNPGGVVWSKETLEKVAEICEKNQTLVFSDEIHADMTLPPHHHIPFAMINEQAKMNSITFMSPSKAFNMPGIVASHVIVFHPSVRRRLFFYLMENDLDAGNVFAFNAVKAAYTQGEEWLKQMLQYVQENIDYVTGYLEKKMPKIKVMQPEASFLLFLNCNELGFSTQKELEDFFVDKAHLALNSGTLFGEEGKGFMRLNVASPRKRIEQAMFQLEEAYQKLEATQGDR